MRRQLQVELQLLLPQLLQSVETVAVTKPSFVDKFTFSLHFIAWKSVNLLFIIKLTFITRLALLKKIRKNMTVEQFLAVASSQIFSIMYYASQVWLNKTLSARLWGKLKSLHYRILRAATRHFKRVSKSTLDKQCKRATPAMWSSHSTSSLEIKILRDRYPKRLEVTYIIMPEHLWRQNTWLIEGKNWKAQTCKLPRRPYWSRVE